MIRLWTRHLFESNFDSCDGFTRDFRVKVRGYQGNR